MVKIPMSPLGSLIAGMGNRFSLDNGNRGNSPGETPLQDGKNNFIQSAMFPNMAIAAIGNVPDAFVDWAQYAVNNNGLSGTTGGGVALKDVPQVNGEPLLSYDANSGVFFNLGALQE